MAQDIRILADWMQNDILSLAGPDLQSRRELYDFVVEELRTLESLCPYRITPVLRMLENNRDNLLAFVGIIERIPVIAKCEQFCITSLRMGAFGRIKFDVPHFCEHE